MLELIEDSKEVKESLELGKKRLEREGRFSEHINPIDYSMCEEVDANFDYQRRGLKNALKRFRYKLILSMIRIEAQKIHNIKVVGRENAKGIKAAMISCNHFNKIDSFAARRAFGNDFKIVSGDFNNFKGIVGDIARHTGLLPISNKISVMRKFQEALNYFFSKNKKVLVYPEQALWWNYHKPRPLQMGCFTWAVKYNVPIIPTFVTFEDSGKKDRDGYVIYNWTLHILKPIYPDKSLSDKENAKAMRDNNYNQWKACYEEVYNKPLVYETD